jgi:hypothetical protein
MTRRTIFTSLIAALSTGIAVAKNKLPGNCKVFPYEQAAEQYGLRPDAAPPGTKLIVSSVSDGGMFHWPKGSKFIAAREDMRVALFASLPKVEPPRKAVTMTVAEAEKSCNVRFYHLPKDATLAVSDVTPDGKVSDWPRGWSMVYMGADKAFFIA